MHVAACCLQRLFWEPDACAKTCSPFNPYYFFELLTTLRGVWGVGDERPRGKRRGLSRGVAVCGDGVPAVRSPVSQSAWSRPRAPRPRAPRAANMATRAQWQCKHRGQGRGGERRACKHENEGWGRPVSTRRLPRSREMREPHNRSAPTPHNTNAPMIERTHGGLATRSAMGARLLDAGAWGSGWSRCS